MLLDGVLMIDATDGIVHASVILPSVLLAIDRYACVAGCCRKILFNKGIYFIRSIYLSVSITAIKYYYIEY